MASPSSIREFRFLTGTTFNTAHTNAASSSWNAVDGTAVKLRITDFDPSGLLQENFQDETLRTRFFGRASSINGLRKGGYKISTYMGGGWANVDATPEEAILLVVAGGQALPTTARSGVCGANCTTTALNIPSIDARVVAGQAFLIGVKGDGRGGGEVKSVNSVSGDVATLKVACSVAPDSGDAVVYSSTTYPDEDATQRYLDSLSIGHGTTDQRQTIAGVPAFSITGLTPSEPPKIEFDVQCADHQIVAVGDRTSLTPSRDPAGQEPAFGKGLGMIHLGDMDSTTRQVVKAGDLTFESGMSYEEVPDLNGVNGIGAYQKMPGVPTMEMTLLVDEDFGLVADHDAQTAKHCIVQVGHAQGACCALEMEECYLDGYPEAAAIGNFQGMKIKLHGEEEFTSSNDLQSAAWRMHKF